MYVEQVSVFLENKAGRLGEVARILAEADINIRALSLADTSDFGVLRLIVSHTDRAEDVLHDNGLTVRRSRVLALAVRDKPGGLLEILDMVGAAGVNIDYMYAYANPKGGKAVMIFRFSPMEAALDLFLQKGVDVLSFADLSAMEQAQA